MRKPLPTSNPASQTIQRVYRPNPFMVKPYSSQELSEFYDVNVKTFVSWLKPFQRKIGKRTGRYYTVVQVEIIFEKIGVPYFLD